MNQPRWSVSEVMMELHYRELSRNTYVYFMMNIRNYVRMYVCMYVSRVIIEPV